MSPEFLGLAMASLFIAMVLSALVYLGHRVGIAEGAAPIKTKPTIVSAFERQIPTIGCYLHGPQSGWPQQSPTPDSELDQDQDHAPIRPEPAAHSQTEKPEEASVDKAKNHQVRQDEQRSAQRDIVSAWHTVAGFDQADFYDKLAKAKGIDKCLLSLERSELAVLICRHGLIDGHRMSWEELVDHLMISRAGASRCETRAILKIDAFHEIAGADFRDYSWSCQHRYWYNRHTIGHGVPKRRAMLTRHQVAAARRRVEEFLAYYNAARATPAPSASDTLVANWLNQQTQVETNAKCRVVSASGAVRPRPTGDRVWGDIDAVEKNFEANWFLDQLGAEERRVIKLAFGIDTLGEHTTEEIALLLGLDLLATREIEMTTLAKLRRLAATRTVDRSP